MTALEKYTALTALNAAHTRIRRSPQRSRCGQLSGSTWQAPPSTRSCAESDEPLFSLRRSSRRPARPAWARRSARRLDLDSNALKAPPFDVPVQAVLFPCAESHAPRPAPSRYMAAGPTRRTQPSPSQTSVARPTTSSRSSTGTRQGTARVCALTFPGVLARLLVARAGSIAQTLEETFVEPNDIHSRDSTGGLPRRLTDGSAPASTSSRRSCVSRRTRRLALCSSGRTPSDSSRPTTRRCTRMRTCGTAT